MFKIGDRVVCINDDFTDMVDVMIRFFDELPRKGKEYTIRRIERFDNRTRVILEEIKNPPMKDGVWKGAEPSFCGSRFRKPDVIKEIEEVVESIGETIEEEL